MNSEILQKITTPLDLSRHYIYRRGFVFTSLTEPADVYDTIVIRSPETADVFSPRFGLSEKNLGEHISIINEYQLEKAIVIAESLDFIARCPSLKFLSVFPSGYAKKNFDYSPLYLMPNIEFLKCETSFGEQNKYTTTIDYSKFYGLRYLFLSGNGHFNFEKLETLSSLNLYKTNTIDSLEGISLSKKLQDLSIVQCNTKSLRGIGFFETLESLSISYNRMLSDISELDKVACSLKTLDITNCPKITDFSVLSKLENLEHFCLFGNNEIEDLSFINNMKKLKTFVFSVNVLDGNLIPCTAVPYVCCLKNRRHYNLKDSDLPKRR